MKTLLGSIPGPGTLKAAAGIVCLVLAGAGRAEDGAAPTFYDDVAPIVSRSCVGCHQPESTAPMALTTYEQVRPWAARIREKVSAREMPPFGAEGPEGFFANDARLSDAEIGTIRAWVDGGGRRGSPPASGERALESPKLWDHGEPDLVVRALVPDLITGENKDDWSFAFFDCVAPGDRWLRGVTVIPEDEKLVHHINTFVIDPSYSLPAEQKLSGNAHLREARLLSLWAPGRPPLWCPEGVAVRMPAGARLGANIHYPPSDTAGEHRLSLGLFFADGRVDYALETRTVHVPKDVIVVPPNESWTVTETRSFANEDLIVYAFAGHMHYRGKEIGVTFRHADGTTSAAFLIPRFDFSWQQKYVLTQPVLVPAQSEAIVSGRLDNTAQNPHNPNPNVEVRGGFRTEDEMMEVYFDVVAPGRPVNLDVMDGVAVPADASGNR